MIKSLEHWRLLTKLKKGRLRENAIILTQTADMYSIFIMKNFIAIDFETGNPGRVSACALGIAKVSNGTLVETKGYLIKPVGGHSPFLSKIHGIKDEHTSNKPNFGELYQEIRDVFKNPLVGHSLFDKQVLNALSEHFDLDLTFTYIDSCAIAKEKLPNLKNHKLKTLAQHFQLPAFKHHDAAADAVACANIFLKLHASENTKGKSLGEEAVFFKGMVNGVLADSEINYKEAYELLYWLEEHPMIAVQYKEAYKSIKNVLSDNQLDSIEATEIRDLLRNIQ